MAEEVLIVTSKLKKYIKDKAGMNTAGNVAEILSEKVRGLVDDAITRAQSYKRKTVKDRDFE